MPMDEFRYLKPGPGAENEQKLFESYSRELINIYGIETSYFRHDSAFFAEPSGHFLNYALGEDTTATFFLSAEVIVLMNVDSDTALLNKFGIQQNTVGSCYVVQRDFTEQFRDMLGTPYFTEFIIPVSGEICDGVGIVSGVIRNQCLNGFTYNNINVGVLTGTISGTFDGGFVRTPEPYYGLLKTTKYYTNQVVNGELVGPISGVLDNAGNGILTGSVSGELLYYDTPAGLAGPAWQIAPQVGDFFRIQFDTKSGNNEEYEITRVYDRDLLITGLNPLLSRHIWKMDIVRRRPSQETVLGCGSNSQENWTPDQNRVSDFYEIGANEEFNYDTEIVDDLDGKQSDQVYGGYGTNKNLSSLYGEDGSKYYVNPFKDCDEDT